MNFGEALQALKGKQQVSREGWNGKGMWLILVPGSEITVAAGRPLGDAAPELIGRELTYRSHIDMKTVDDEIVPWVASQSDLLAEDWFTIDA